MASIHRESEKEYSRKLGFRHLTFSEGCHHLQRLSNTKNNSSFGGCASPSRTAYL